ncbi:MAG: hypothetical protein ACFFAS_13535 [Promethearchaeota archaeon]
MSEDEKSIEVRCPICKQVGWVNITTRIPNNSKRGLYTAEIPKGSICQHAFIGYIDENLMFRDCFIADFRLKSPNEEAMDDPNWIEQVQENSLDLSLIKLNCSSPLLIYILKAMFNNKKITLIIEDTFLHEHLRYFLELITRGTFNLDISILSKGEHDPNSDLLDPYISLEGNNIVYDRTNLLADKYLEIEKKIVSKFLNELDLVRSLILIKNEIRKAYMYSQALIDYLNKAKKGNIIDLKEIRKHLNTAFKINLKNNYLNFLVGIAENYFGIQIQNLTKK